MTKMKKKMKKNSRKNVKWMAAAVLTATLLSGQVMPSAAAGSNTEISVSTIIPDNITIESPVPLSEISLPKSEYGKLSWADDSIVPTKRSEAFEVVFCPAESFDLSRIEDWDGESEKITGYITVVVSSISQSEENGEDGNEEEAEIPAEDSSEYDTEDGFPEDEANIEETGNGNGTEEAAPEEADGNEPQETENQEENITGEAEDDPADSAREDAEQTIDGQAGTDGPEDPPVEEKEEEQDTEVPAEETENAAPEKEPEEDSKESGSTKDQPAAGEDGGQEKEEEAPVSEENEDSKKETEENQENIFDRVNEEVKDERPVTAEEDLTEEEMQQRAEENHSCDGIYVSGIHLPWYVQFRATSGESYEFTNESHANIFRSYEFELWDLRNDTEYEIPDGEYISVTIPVKEGYEYTVEHLLDNGATETIIPSVEGSTMIFSTHSFSPFGIAGSKPLVGGELSENTYLTPTPTSAPTKAPTKAPTQTPANTNNNTNNGNTNNGVPGNEGSNTGEPTKDRPGYSTNAATPTPEGKENSSSGNGSSGNGTADNSRNTANQPGKNGTSTNAVKTGDDTQILPFVILVAAAIVIILAVLFLKKKKK